MTKPLIITKPVSLFAANAARLSIISGIFFVVLLLSLHLLEPEFDPTWRFVSEYMLGNFGWMMHLAFLALAVSLASSAVAIFPQIRIKVGYIGLFGLGLSAVGILIAAIFTTNSISTAQDALTFSGKMHVFGASLDWTPVAALLLSLSLSRNQAWRKIRKSLFITAGITLIFMGAFMSMLPYDGKFHPGVYAGLFGRFLLISYLGWLLTVGLHVIKLRKRESK